MRPEPHKYLWTFTRVAAWVALGLGLSAWGAGGPPSVLVAPHSLPGADLFTNGAVEQIGIQIAPGDVESLKRDPRQFIRATVSEAGRTYRNVAVHLKGSVGSFRPIDDKPGFTLDFERFAAGEAFHGLRRIHLNNSVEDPSYANEHLGSELFRAAGVPAPRAGYALVRFNGRRLGLYVLKEGFTEDFLSGYFQHVGGELYEPESGHDIDQHLKRNSARAPAGDRHALKALAAAAHVPDLARRWEQLDQTLDAQRFIAFMALEVMISHRDGYCLARNNFRVYHDLDSGRMVFLPHGMDQLFGIADLSWKPSMAGLVARALRETTPGEQLYEQEFKDLFTNLFKPDVLTKRVDELVLGLRPFVQAEEFRNIRTEAGELKARIAQRNHSLQLQLAQPAPRALEFSNGLVRLDAWKKRDEPAGGKMGRTITSDGVGALYIATSSNSMASWRTERVLPRGHYRFEGRARVNNVMPLPFGKHQGAALRVEGRSRDPGGLTGNSNWQPLGTDFEVAVDSETIVFICELRASSGETWFDSNSLQVSSIEH